MICDAIQGAVKYLAEQYPYFIESTIEFGTYPYDAEGNRKPIEWEILTKKG